MLHKSEKSLKGTALTAQWLWVPCVVYTPSCSMRVRTEKRSDKQILHIRSFLVCLVTNPTYFGSCRWVPERCDNSSLFVTIHFGVPVLKKIRDEAWGYISLKNILQTFQWQIGWSSALGHSSSPLPINIKKLIFLYSWIVLGIEVPLLFHILLNE